MANCNAVSNTLLFFVVTAFVHNLNNHAQCTPLFANQVNNSFKQTIAPLSKYSIKPIDLIDGPFTTLSSHIPQSSCPLMSTEFTFILDTPKGLRVPHSRMLVDGLKCGKMADNATEKELFADTYMQLMTIDSLKDEDTARANHVYNAYYELHTLSRPFPKSFFDFMLRERNDRGLMTYVGFERFSPRVCTNGKESVRLERGSLIFVGGVHGKNVSVTQLISRLPKGKQVYLPPNNPYQITFTPDEGRDTPEHVCALKLDWRNRLGKSDGFVDEAEQGSINVRMCFSSNGVLDRIDGKRIGMDKLQVGDVVRSASDEYSEIFMFSHRDKTAYSKMVSLKCENGASLQVSHGHYIQGAGGVLRAAETLRKGDVVQTTGGASRIQSIETTWEHGLYNPHTLSGLLVVNGVMVSCYTTAVAPRMAHALLTGVRASYQLLGRNVWAEVVPAEWMRAWMRAWMGDGCGAVLLALRRALALCTALSASELRR